MKIRYNINPLLIDSASGNTETLPQISIEADYTASLANNTFVIPVSNIYKTVSFANVTESVILYLSSTEPLTVKLNGGSQEFENIRDFLIKGTFTQIDIKNLSTADAEVRFDVYGI